MNILQIKAENNKKNAEFSIKNKMFDVGVSRYYYYVYLLIVRFVNSKTTAIERENMKTHYHQFSKLHDIINDNNINILINCLNKMRKARNVSEYSDKYIISNSDDFSYYFYNNYQRVLSLLRKLEVCDV